MSVACIYSRGVYACCVGGSGAVCAHSVLSTSEVQSARCVHNATRNLNVFVYMCTHTIATFLYSQCSINAICTMMGSHQRVSRLSELECRDQSSGLRVCGVATLSRLEKIIGLFL